MDGGLGEGVGRGVEGVGDSLFECISLLLFDTEFESDRGVISTDGGRDGDLVGVKLDAGGCKGGAIFEISFEAIEDGTVTVEDDGVRDGWKTENYLVLINEK